jgi:hypothetical protein
MWPFYRDRRRGYGIVSINGHLHKAHRVMCELAHGEAPTVKHEAAHSCGNGWEGCVNPMHLSWKTRKENQADRKVHGTAGQGKKGTYRRYRLTPEKVAQIRSLIGVIPTQEIADQFDVHRSTIRQIETRRIWAVDHKMPAELTPEQVSAIKAQRGKRSIRALAAEYGVGNDMIYRIHNGLTYTAEAPRPRRSEHASKEG